MVSKRNRLKKIIALMDKSPRITLDDIDEEFSQLFDEERE